MSAIRRMVLVTVAASMALANLVPVFALSEGSAAFGSSLDASGCTGVPITSVANLQQSITSYGGGTTFCLAPGIYRIPTTLTLKTDQRLIGAGEPGTVVISGAKAVKATPTSGRWVISGQKTLGKSSFSGTSTQCRPINGKDPKGMCVYKDQVFLDDVSLWQVPSLKALSRGEFFWNYSTNKIYLADDPTGRRLEVSVVGGRALM